eukprot:gene24938-10589_t
MTACFNVNPSKRPSAWQLINHPWAAVSAAVDLAQGCNLPEAPFGGRSLRSDPSLHLQFNPVELTTHSGSLPAQQTQQPGRHPVPVQERVAAGKHLAAMEDWNRSNRSSRSISATPSYVQRKEDVRTSRYGAETAAAAAKAASEGISCSLDSSSGADVTLSTLAAREAPRHRSTDIEASRYPVDTAEVELAGVSGSVGAEVRRYTAHSFKIMRPLTHHEPTFQRTSLGSSVFEPNLHQRAPPATIATDNNRASAGHSSDRRAFDMLSSDVLPSAKHTSEPTSERHPFDRRPSEKHSSDRRASNRHCNKKYMRGYHPGTTSDIPPKQTDLPGHPGTRSRLLLDPVRSSPSGVRTSLAPHQGLRISPPTPPTSLDQDHALFSITSHSPSFSPASATNPSTSPTMAHLRVINTTLAGEPSSPHLPAPRNSPASSPNSGYALGM